MFNILDIIFLSLTISFVIIGFGISHYEAYIPDVIIQGYKFGSFAFRGSGVNYLKNIEMQKNFAQIYVFSCMFSLLILVYAVLVYCFGFNVDNNVFETVKYLFEQDKPSVSAGAASLVSLLLVIQCCRRCYESFFVQVFSKSSKMNLLHCVGGYVHYFGVIAAAVGEAPLFCGDQNRGNVLWIDNRTILLAIPCLITFGWASHEQYMSHKILANLRKDKKSGEVVTEEHRIPHGRLFNYVSSPHRLCEMILYLVFYTLASTKTYFIILIWVICNQTLAAFFTHKWYINTFKDYPRDRWAVLPGVL